MAGASEFVVSAGYVERPFDGSQESDGWPPQGVSADCAEATTAVTLTAGRLTDLRDSTVALPAEHAGKLGTGVGDTITMRLGDGAVVDLRVVALFAGTPGYDKLLLPVDLLAAHTATGLPTQILVRAGPGVDTATLTSALSGLAAARPGVAVADRDAMTVAYAEEQRMQASVNYLMVGMIMAYAAISVGQHAGEVDGQAAQGVRAAAAHRVVASAGAADDGRGRRAGRGHRHRARHDRVEHHAGAVQHGGDRCADALRSTVDLRSRPAEAAVSPE